MKKIITIVLVLLCGITAYGQNGFVIGIKGGISRASISGKDLDSLSNGTTKSLSGAVIGITLNNKFNEYFWIKHELFYSKRSMNILMNDGVNPVFNSNLKQQYIDVFPASPTLNYKGLQVYAGPYIGILLNASLQRKDSNGKLYTDKSFYGNATASGDYSQKFDAGLIAGVEYGLPLGINIGVRYVSGFVPLIENPDNQQQWRIYNQNFSVTLGYTIFK